MSKALVIVDVQNDFCEGGSLAVPGGNAVAAAVGDLVGSLSRETYAVVVASKDNHRPHSTNGGHFAKHNPPDYVDTWPAHCVQGTEGNQLHERVKSALDAYQWGHVIVEKGAGEPAFSVFDGFTDADSLRPKTPFHVLLEQYRITELDVVGIATDYCVKATVLDALQYGYKVNVLLKYCAGVANDSTIQAKREMVYAGATVYETEPEKTDA